MVSGRTGRTTSWPALKAAETGEQPVACAPKILYGDVVDETEGHQLAERLVDLGELRTGGHRDHDLLRQPPAERLGDLVAEGLGALRVVGPDVDVHERPVLVVAGQLGGDPVHVVVGPLDRDQDAAVHGGGDDLLLLEVGRDQHHRADPGPGGGRRDRVGEVAGRRAGQGGEAELAGRSQRDADDPVLERVGRVGAVVLDPQRPHAQLAGQVVRGNQRGAARLEVRGVAHGRRDRQQVLVAPDVLRAGLDRGPGDGAELVGDLERAEALAAGVERAERHGRAALAAGQVAGGAEIGTTGDGHGGRRGGCGTGRHEQSPSSSVPVTRCPGPELAP